MPTDQIDFTVVLGVDSNHIQKLKLVLPTWAKHKPSLLKNPFLVFYDKDTALNRIHPIFEDLDIAAAYQIWPSDDSITYDGDPNSKWFHPQRYKMLSGFVHVAALRVKTKYWLKIDLDVVATGVDNWIQRSWFKDSPAVVSHPWGYTKPPDQMIVLDRWAAKHADDIPEFKGTYPLNLFPTPGSSALPHKRIISWCSFWRTDFVRFASRAANDTCGEGKLPVPSQDGYLWYLAKRLGEPIVTPNMKRLGWQHCSSIKGICEAIDRYKWGCDA